MSHSLLKEFLSNYIENLLKEEDLSEDDLNEFSGAGAAGGNTVSSALGGSSLGGHLGTNINTIIKEPKKNKNKSTSRKK